MISFKKTLALLLVIIMLLSCTKSNTFTSLNSVKAVTGGYGHTSVLVPEELFTFDLSPSVNIGTVSLTGTITGEHELSDIIYQIYYDEPT